MNDQRLSSDIINTLPENVIGKILCDLPLRNAVRTSIFSSKWRYSWTNIPALCFDDKLFQASSNSERDKKHKFGNAIFQVLLLHSGPLLHFTLKIGELNMNSEIDPIIRYLSKSNTLKSFYLENKLDDRYRIPSVLSSFQPLEDLTLEYCAFDLPLTFNGLGKLRDLTLSSVSINAKMLQRLLLNCPLLKKLVLNKCPRGFKEGNKFTFVELCECLPSIVHLAVDISYIPYLVEDGMPLKLSTPLGHLKTLYLDVCLTKEDHLSSLLCLIRSSPNLQKINITMGRYDSWFVECSMDFFYVEDYLSFKLNHLEDLKIETFRNLPNEMEFVNFIMAKSPVLKRVQIILDFSVSVDEEVKMLRDLVRDPIPRASPSTKLIITRN